MAKGDWFKAITADNQRRAQTVKKPKLAPTSTKISFEVRFRVKIPRYMRLHERYPKVRN